MEHLNYSKNAKTLHVAFFSLILLGCCLVPYFWFGVVPIKSDRQVETEYIDVTLSPIMPEDELERDVLLEEFRWCRYCHVMQPGHPDEPGPSLYKIFGRRAATVPGFYYSDVFLQAGEDKLYWTEQTIDEFITDPQKYLPGNRMFHGPIFIDDPERRKRVINLLKKWTAEGSTYGKKH
ncbi:c-type cytochrome [Oceanicoccus sagamiensis]|uniref:Cytochrome c domain-containing protein n=1 Tax=Oceanicoccus sagamiensis TaxID=716816 RepID=A0A1X9NDW0_9GAMM|nr:hypothetical protein [Oceanicoccus sagamiensis]ARN73137.1 hypothetical protein BST96_02860 [Oceanicoccus sagamiensis]